MNNKLFHNSQQTECEKKKVVESAQESALPFVPIFLRKMTFNDPQGCSGLVIYLHLLLLVIIYPILTSHYTETSFSDPEPCDSL